jgi:hypothetical protein
MARGLVVVEEDDLLRGPIACVGHRQGDSSYWTKLLKVENLYLENRTMVVGDGRKTSFWIDAWSSQLPLKLRFPDLFEICEQQYISVQEAASIHWNPRYRRWLDENQQNQLAGLRNILLTYPLGKGIDKPVWNLNEKKTFTVKRMYRKLTKYWRNGNFKLQKSRFGCG